MKRIAIAVVTAVALVALLIAAIPFVVPGEFMREIVATMVSRWTGRTVTVTGVPHLSIYPEFAVTVDDLSIANEGGNGEDAFVTVESVRAQIRALPFLFRKVEFWELELIRPRVRLIVDKAGATNWNMSRSEFARRSHRAAQRTVESTGEGAVGEGLGIEAQADDVKVGRVKITDGMILYDDLASDHREEITGVNLEVDWPNISAAISGRGSLTWRGETVQFNGSAGNPLTLIAGGVSPLRFAVAATRLRANFVGQATDLSKLAVTGKATVSTPSLRRAIAWTGVPVGDGAILSAASINGNLLWSGSTLTFDAATVELDGNRAAGTLSLLFGADQPAIAGSLSAPRLDLTPYMEATRAAIGVDGPWIIAPARLPFANSVKLDVNLSADEVLLGTSRLASVAGGITLVDGAFSVDVDEAQLYGGNLSGRISAVEVGDALAANAKLEAVNVPAGLALGELLGTNALDGTATATLDFRSRGQTWGEFARALSGTADIDVSRGRLAGVDVFDVTEILSDPLAGPIAPVGGDTSFARLSAGLAIADGALATDDLTMTGEGFEVSVTGKGSLINGLIEGKANMAVGDNRVPVSISGRWRAPVFTRDVETAGPEMITTEQTSLPTGG